MSLCRDNPTVFEYGRAKEYDFVTDVFLQHRLLSMSSEVAVVALDTEWQIVLKLIADVVVHFDEHDPSSKPRLRPDATGMLNSMLMWKCEAKSSLVEMVANSVDLVKKMHKTAFKLFPAECSEIPSWLSCNEEIQLVGIRYDTTTKRYTQRIVKQYRVSEMAGRVEFISDLFKMVIWMLSQGQPLERFHLVPGVRKQTPNGHHVTLTESGLLKEFKPDRLPHMQLLKQLYAFKLPNVEWGETNCTSVTITRVGSRLRDVIESRGMGRDQVWEEVKLGVRQMHANGIAHCDICVDNIFVESVEDGGKVFLGDLEYCRPVDAPAPTDLRRSDRRARTAAELDELQLEALKDGLARV
jgi:hypothetical protein